VWEGAEGPPALSRATDDGHLLDRPDIIRSNDFSKMLCNTVARSDYLPLPEAMNAGCLLYQECRACRIKNAEFVVHGE
jgi:hypothetical protein